MWKRKDYLVKEVGLDFDLHLFQVIKDNEVVATISPNSIENMKAIIADLDAGEDVNGWEDGKGNTITI